MENCLRIKGHGSHLNNPHPPCYFGQMTSILDFLCERADLRFLRAYRVKVCRLACPTPPQTVEPASLVSGQDIRLPGSQAGTLSFSNRVRSSALLPKPTPQTSIQIIELQCIVLDPSLNQVAPNGFHYTSPEGDEATFTLRPDNKAMFGALKTGGGLSFSLERLNFTPSCPNFSGVGLATCGSSTTWPVWGMMRSSNYPQTTLPFPSWTWVTSLYSLSLQCCPRWGR